MLRHRERLGPVVEPHLERASLGIRHPVVDFLFHYYRFSPSRLMRWSPGWGVTLAGAAPGELDGIKEGIFTDQGWSLDPGALTDRVVDAMRKVLALLEAVAGRDPRYGCFGLHEWAMVYRSAEVRHAAMPLRLSHEATDRVVEQFPLACTHYDAFRFFTPGARAMSRNQPSAATRMEMEQPGCLHVNMDLYKWSARFYPWVDGELIADCFLLAYEIRELDMRASPYDMRELGYDPVPVETREGRRAYAREQKRLAEAAVPLRARLIGKLNTVLAAAAGGQARRFQLGFCGERPTRSISRAMP